MRKNDSDKDFDDIIQFNVNLNEIRFLPGATQVSPCSMRQYSSPSHPNSNLNSNFQDLFDFIARYTKSNRINYSKIRQESRTRIRLTSSYFPEVFSVSKNLVKSWTRSLSLTAVPGLYSDLDLEKDKYEGGFKVWEGTCDLIKFLTNDDDVIKNLMDRESTLRVLELGAGSGLASLSLISRLVYDNNFKSAFRVHLQDYNWEVLGSLTLMNFAANLPKQYFEALLDTRSLRFFYGDWGEFRNKRRYKYDLIIMSEVIYNSDNYESLHNLFDRHLRKNGYVVMATKDTYFGLSGGLYSWLDYLDTKNIFTPYRTIKVPNVNIPRSTLILNRKSLNI